MPRLVTEATLDARRLLQDQAVPFRYPDADLLEYANQAITAMHRLRPDLMVGGAWQPPARLTGAQELPAIVDTWFFSALVSYIVGMAESRDDQFADGSRALVFVSRLGSAMQGQGI